MGILRKVGIRMGKLNEIGGAVVDLLTIGAVTAVAGTVGTIVVFNIASSAPADPVWEELRCIVGISFNDDEKCFKKRLSSEIDKVSAIFDQQKKELEKEVEALEVRRASLEQEKASIADERAGFAGQLKKLEEIEKSSTSFTIFTDEDWKRGLSVTTGIKYRSFVRSQEWTNAWCYVQFQSESGVSSKLELGNLMSGGEVEFLTPPGAALAAGMFTAEDVAEAQKLCAFPKGIS